MSNTWKIYLLAVVSFLVGTSENIIAGILDMIAQDAGVSVASAGQLITVFSIAYAFGTPVLMALFARVERRKLMIAALGVFAVGNALTIAAPGFGTLMASRVVLALGTGLFVVVALTVGAKLAQPGRQASAIATLVMGFSSSLIVGVPLGRVIAASYDWKAIFAGIGVLALAAMVAIYRAIPKSEGERPVPLGSQLAYLKQPRVAIALSVTFFWIAGYSILYTYISPFLLDVAGMGEREVSIGLFAFGVASLIGSKLGGFGTDRWGVPRTLVGGMLLHAATLIALSTFAGTGTAVVFPLLMLWAFAAWSSGPTQQYHLMTLSPEASGIMLSLNSSVLQLAMAAGAGIGGAVVEGVSLSAVGWIGAAGVTVAALTAAWSVNLSRIRARAARTANEALFSQAEL